MNTTIQVYNNIVAKVSFFFKQLKIKVVKSTGRTLAITPEHTISLALFKQSQGIETKKAVWKIFEPKCSYKTMVVNINKLALHALVIMYAITRMNREHSHMVKHTDSTDIPV